MFPILNILYIFYKILFLSSLKSRSRYKRSFSPFFENFNNGTRRAIFDSYTTSDQFILSLLQDDILEPYVSITILTQQMFYKLCCILISIEASIIYNEL